MSAMSGLDPAIAARLKRNAEGLIAAVVQERGSGDVLMVAWMDDDALARTLATREATYFSRSRNEQWTCCSVPQIDSLIAAERYAGGL